MLKLKRVDIHGFKSFYDRTEMRFHGSGIAAIVGPNGCGKSNLSDAISWVLGEQSAKSLRGARMEDVIFAGTRERKPLGMAQVTLTMSDPAGHLPMEELANGHPKAEEVTITRRLYRSGESEYLINGKTARLRDIQDLFSGTGLGPESYAIIEQGRIGQILSNKPADRRAIIEEAAGIGKYKTRKRLAEAKLESARQNLSRVFDILEEVGRQANSLKRQASKAKRYEELRAEMVAHLRRAVSGRFEMLEREAAKLALDLNQAQTSFQTLSANVAEQERSQTATQESCYRVEAALTAARGMVAELNLESERTRGRLELQAKQIAAIDQRLTAGEAETQELDTRQDARSRNWKSRLRPSRRSSRRARRCAPGSRKNAGARRTAERSARARTGPRNFARSGAAAAGRGVDAAQSARADGRISGGDGARCRSLAQRRRRGAGGSDAAGRRQERIIRAIVGATIGARIAGGSASRG